jgi:CRP-like cAMP-binding protein
MTLEPIATGQRTFTRRDMAELLIAKTALTELDLEQALQIARLMVHRHVPAGTVLIQEGVTSTGYMAMVLQGEAVVENEIGGPNDSLVLSVLGTGSLFGEMGVLDGKPRSATVTAVTEVHIAVLDRSAMVRLVETSPTVACALMGALMSRLSERLRQTNAKLRKMTAIQRTLEKELQPRNAR